jgi:hypothetical protein
VVPWALSHFCLTTGISVGSIATLVQKKLGDISAKSVFAQLQSAAMTGATRVEIEKMATIAFAGLGAAGAVGLIGAVFKPFGQATDFELAEWRSWEAESRVDYSPEVASKMVSTTAMLETLMPIATCNRHDFGDLPPRRAASRMAIVSTSSCAPYKLDLLTYLTSGEYRAPMWFVPNGVDPLQLCLQTPSAIKGVGFKTPLGCVNEVSRLVRSRLRYALLINHAGA